MSTSSTFLRFWLSENCRNALLRNVDRDTLPAMRLVCHNFAATTSPYCFKEIDITFRPSTFKASRLLSLNRIGRHVKKLRFNVPHSADSFLPPLLDPLNGEQLSFNYVPQVENSKNQEPKYGTWEMTDMLIQQYPPMFHAATNIPSFIRAFSTMPNITHMTIFSPDQNMSPRYRRSTADYTLVSLRIAIERSPLRDLSSLTLKAIHPSALLYLQPVLSFGSTPNSCRRWTQINNLSIVMDSTPFSFPKSDDQLRVVQAYLRAFCTSVTHFSFRWTGPSKGPSPLSPDAELPRWNTGRQGPPTPPKNSSPPSPKGAKSIRFFNLKYLTLQYATMDSDQVASFITAHRQTLVEFNFEDVSLRQGSWESTLEPLRHLKRSERSHSRLQAAASARELPKMNPSIFGGSVLGEGEMYVPCKLSPVDMPCEDLVVMDTLEPQPEELPQQPSSWLGRWLDKNPRPTKRKHERTVSDHLRKVLRVFA
jgi:hypothetical protein